MKFSLGLPLLTLIALASTTVAQEAGKKEVSAPKVGRKGIVKADEETTTAITQFIKTKWNGSVKRTKKSKAKSKNKSKKGVRVVYLKRKVKKNGKTWKRIAIKKDKVIHAAIRVQRKCPTKGSITKDMIKQTMTKSLTEGKYYKINCAGKISIVKKKSKKSKKAKKAKKSSDSE